MPSIKQLACVPCVLRVCCVCAVHRAQSDALSEDMSEATPHAGELAQAGSGSFSNLQVGSVFQPLGLTTCSNSAIPQCRITPYSEAPCTMRTVTVGGTRKGGARTRMMGGRARGAWRGHIEG